jgi:hypothetical protein
MSDPDDEIAFASFFSHAPADNPSGRQSYRPVSDACPVVRPPSDLIDFLPDPIFCLFG